MSGPSITTIENDIAVLTMDDGRANALGHTMIDALNKALDEAETSGKGGVDRRPRKALLRRLRSRRHGLRTGKRAKAGDGGAELLTRLYEYRLPVVMACTGHALAAGGLLLLSADSRIGTEGDFRIGLPEVAIGMTMPVYGIELALDRLARNRFTEAVTQARIYGPADAVAVGYLDAAVPAQNLMETAKARAAELAGLQQPAFAGTKRKERQLTIRHIRDTLHTDSDTFDGSKPR